jgi:signal transduction histidine kinase
VLIVEDEQIVALELTDRLTRMGHSVLGVAASGEEAIERARRCAPDLVLMDVKLQGAIDGIDAADAIHQFADVPIVYLTAFADDTTLQRAKLTEPYGYILKPFQERELHVVIEVSLYRHRMERALHRAVRMRDDVLSVVSHDLRNPLSSIRMSADQLLRVPAEHDPLRVRNNAATIRRNADRMGRLIDDLLDVGRIDAGRLSIERGRVPATSLVAETLATFASLASESSLRLVCGPVPDADVLCDRGRVLQVFSNLIGNALRFARRDGTIVIGGETCGGFVRFTVADEGCGIAPDHLEHVFERNWQAPAAGHGGSGLGLYIARGIVEAHGGRISVDSTQGHGTTFRFTIPLAEPT